MNDQQPHQLPAEPPTEGAGRDLPVVAAHGEVPEEADLQTHVVFVA